MFGGYKFILEGVEKEGVVLMVEGGWLDVTKQKHDHKNKRWGMHRAESFIKREGRNVISLSWVQTCRRYGKWDYVQVV